MIQYRMHSNHIRAVICMCDTQNSLYRDMNVSVDPLLFAFKFLFLCNNDPAS